jgi:hypothetical protein
MASYPAGVPPTLTADQVNTILDQRAYRPGWQFRAYTGETTRAVIVEVLATVPDSYRPGLSVPLEVYCPVPAYVDDELTFDKWLAWRLQRLEVHESPGVVPPPRPRPADGPRVQPAPRRRRPRPVAHRQARPPMTVLAPAGSSSTGPWPQRGQAAPSPRCDGGCMRAGSAGTAADCTTSPNSPNVESAAYRHGRIRDHELGLVLRRHHRWHRLPGHSLRALGQLPQRPTPRADLATPPRWPPRRVVDGRNQ